jgi:thiamine pyrophosphate-dependent acetolactate synthase large subunit-like protein
MGWYVVRVEEPEKIRDALKEGANQDKPVLIDIVTSKELSMEPPDLAILGNIWMEGEEFPT